MLFILIPGLILVALMVYASTRIKRTAATAFEPETIETSDFTLEKPEGFLNVVNGDPAFAFEAYSKEFGSGNADEFRQGRAVVTIHAGSSHDAVAGEARSKVDSVVSEINEKLGDSQCRVIEARRDVNGVSFKVFFKVAAAGDKIFELEIVVLDETTGEFLRKIEVMLDSFALK